MPRLPSPSPARRNRSATATTLSADPTVAAAPLPPQRAWDELTVAWWADVWASPMAPEFDTTDRHGLLLLAVLVDEFWRAPSRELAGEIRLQRQCYGLSPVDRRRLQWRIERAPRTATAPKPRATRRRRGPDPRALLTAV